MTITLLATQSTRMPGRLSPGRLHLANSAASDAYSAVLESFSAESPSNSAARASNSAELQVTRLQSSKANSTEVDAYSVTFASNSAESELIDEPSVNCCRPR